MTKLPEGVIGLDLKELKGDGKCRVCKKPLLAEVQFYRVSITHFITDMNEVRCLLGLNIQMGGNATLTMAFAPSTNIAGGIPAEPVFICADCAMDPERSLMQIWPNDED